MSDLNRKNINKIMNRQHTIDSGWEKRHVNTIHDWLKTCRTSHKTLIAPVVGISASGTYKNNVFIPYLCISNTQKSK